VFWPILSNRRQEVVLSQQEDGAEHEQSLLQQAPLMLAQQQQARPGGALSAQQDALLGARTSSIDSKFPAGALRNNPLFLEFVSRSLMLHNRCRSRRLLHRLKHLRDSSMLWSWLSS
jgi:hypothetical protein